MPVAERTRSQKSAVVQFWRRKKLFTLGNDESPTPRSHAIFLRKKGCQKVGGFLSCCKTFKESKSAGYEKLKQRSHDSYTGLTERKIRQVTSSNNRYRVHNAAFTNKAVPKPVRAHHVQSQHQVDLVDSSKEPVELGGKSYRYILSVMDVFSRYLWLVPLPTKSSRDIARELKKICERDGPPDRLQSDQGLEFHGRVENIFETYKIRRIRSRPYHPTIARQG